MATLYVHPADSPADSSPNSTKQDEEESYDEHYLSTDHQLNHYQSPQYVNQQQQQQHRAFNPYHVASPTSSVLSASTSTSTVPPPPELFFPVDEDDRKNSKHIGAHPQLHASGLPNLSNLPALPPLSELTANDGKLLLSIEDLSSLNKLSVSEIQRELNSQRLKNETVLAKLHMDQKTFLKVCKHYEKKNAKLQRNIADISKKNNTSVKSAQVMMSLLVEHKSEVGMHQQENVQSQISKASLWKGIATNMQLLSEVNGLNKQIDAYHLLIAKKNQQYTQDAEQQNKTKKKNKEDDINDDAKQLEESCTHTIKKTKSGFDTTSIVSSSAYTTNENRNTDDPTANYARQLIAKNERYHEILTLLREKVDEIRACRKRL